MAVTDPESFRISKDDFSPEAILASQDNLTELCNRNQPDTREVFSPNAYYGHDFIIKLWAGLPHGYALKFAMPHGIETELNDSSFSVKENVPVVCYYYKPKREARLSEGHRHVWPMAAPFLYALELADRPKDRVGTIVFPNHSHPTLQSALDYEALGDRLLATPDRFKPITVSVYFIDIRLGLHRPLLERGIRVFCAGNAYDPLFLIRHQYMCRSHEFANSNEGSSALFYALSAGCKYADLGISPPRWNRIPIEYIEKRESVSYMENLMRSLSGLTQLEQKKIGDKYLGAEFLASPTQLRNMCLRAEMVDKFGFVSRNQLMNGWTFEFPRALKRLAMAPLSKMGAIKPMRGFDKA